MKKLLIIPVITLLISCNCKKAAVAEGNDKLKQQMFEVLAESQYQGKEEASYEVIKDEASLKALYQSINNEDVPKIDFKNQRVVALFLGQKNSGGHAITIKNVTEKDGKISVEVQKTSPKPGENATMAMTNPYCIAKINSTKEIVFN
ncbi:protease complex subunit PrcB family protein [Flavobacterium sp. PLA-1-15]|uniref:protease complex subunit PrcB family protein n=1 Tax=Flavobacterium sp. PLA-1-15 TaxID=3380533 RepID=UPI003B7FFBCA